MGGLLSRFRLLRRTLAVTFAVLLATVGLAISAPSAEAIPSPDCQFSRSKFNQGWSTNFGGQIGTESYRTYGDLYFWDRCDHGWVSGTIAVYGANLENNDITWTARFLYRPDDSSTYRATDLHFQQYFEEGGWTYYYVSTQSYVDFSGGSGYFRGYRVGLRTVFDQDIKSQKLVAGNHSGNSWSVTAGNGF